MGAAPEGPRDNGGGFDLALRQARKQHGGFPAPTSGSAAALADHRQAAFWGRGRVGLAADGGQHGKGQHDERDVPMPAVPGAGLVVVETEFVFGRLEAVLDGPAPAFDRHQGFHSGPGGAPGGEKGQVAISDIAADQKAPGPQTGQGLVVFGGFKIGQFQIGPVEQPLALGSGPGR